jgi:hypothetical protein
VVGRRWRHALSRRSRGVGCTVASEKEALRLRAPFFVLATLSFAQGLGVSARHVRKVRPGSGRPGAVGVELRDGTMRRRSVLFGSADQILKRLKAARLDATCDQELGRLIWVDCCSSITSVLAPRPPRDARLLRDRRRAPPPLRHPLDLQPGSQGVASADGRPDVGPLGGGSSDQLGL